MRRVFREVDTWVVKRREQEGLHVAGGIAVEFVQTVPTYNGVNVIGIQ